MSRDDCERKTAFRGKLRLAVVGRRGQGGLFQTDNTGNSDVAGVQPSIKCNLMPRGMFMWYVSDPVFPLH